MWWCSKEFCVSCLVDWDLAPATVPTISVPCVILQLPDQLHQSRLSSHPARPITGQSWYHVTLAFTVSELSLVWSLVMGDYSIPGSHSVCVTGESFHHLPPSLPPSLFLPSVFYCNTNCRFYCQHQISTSVADYRAARTRDYRVDI